MVASKSSTNVCQKKCFLAFAWAVLLLLPNFLWVFVAHDPFEAFMRGLAPSIAGITFAFAWLPNPRWLIRASLPFQALVPAEVYYISTYHQPSSPLVLGIIGESNAIEAIEFIGIWPLFLMFTAGLTLFVLGWHLSRNYNKLKIDRRIIWLRIASLFPVLLLTYLEVDWQQVESKVFALPNDFKGDARLNVPPPSPSEALLIHSFPFGVPFRAAAYLRERQALHSVANDIKHLRVVANRTAKPIPPEIYVLVIGESAVSTHWELNGYQRKTNPWLSNKEGLVSLSNVISPWPATRMAVPVLITGQQKPNGRAPLIAPSIVQIFKAAGFSTYWISNQMPLGLHDSIIAIHAHSADVTLFTNPGNIHASTPPDEVLLSPFFSYIKDDSPRKFFVIHLLGSHKSYNKRYPKSFIFFNKSDHQKPIDQYDDSIRYTDFILYKIITAIESIGNVRAAVMYVSDHGETLPDSNCDSSGHGYGSENDYRVAAMIWASERLRKERPSLIPTLEKHKSWPFSSSHAAVTLADLANINFKEWNPRDSWIHPDWKPSTRWTNVTENFDKAKRKGACKLLVPR